MILLCKNWRIRLIQLLIISWLFRNTFIKLTIILLSAFGVLKSGLRLLNKLLVRLKESFKKEKLSYQKNLRIRSNYSTKSLLIFKKSSKKSRNLDSMQKSASISTEQISLEKKLQNVEKKLNLSIIENRCSNKPYQLIKFWMELKVDFYRI